LTLALREAGDQAPDAWQMWGGPCPELAALKPISSPQEAAEPLRVFAAGLAQGVELDLLQGSYSRHAQAGRWLRPWRLAAALAAAWLGLQVAVQSAEYWRLNRERVRLQAEMEQLYRTAVPGAQRIVNPRAQLENRLRELRGGDPAGTEAAFLDLLRRGGRMLIEFPQIRLTGLRYNNQQLDLNLSGDSLETLERLRQKLTEQTGWEANMRTTKREDRIESLLTLRKTTS
jgi:general secretion pathway protein L